MNEMMMDINMLGPRGNTVFFCNGTSALVITENWERMRRGKFCESQEEFDPDCLFDSISKSIVLRYSRGR